MDTMDIEDKMSRDTPKMTVTSNDDVFSRFSENPYPMSPTLDSTGEATQATASGAGAVTSPTSDTEADGD